MHSLTQYWVISIFQIILLALVLASAAKNMHYVVTADFVYNEESGAAQCAFGLVRTGTWVIAWQVCKIR